MGFVPKHSLCCSTVISIHCLWALTGRFVWCQRMFSAKLLKHSYYTATTFCHHLNIFSCCLLANNTKVESNLVLHRNSSAYLYVDRGSGCYTPSRKLSVKLPTIVVTQVATLTPQNNDQTSMLTWRSSPITNKHL